MDQIIHFFNAPFFTVVGGITVLLAVLNLVYLIYLVLKGVIPVWYRLGMGLSKSKIAIFATEESNSLKTMITASKIFKEKNIIIVDPLSRPLV